MPVATHSLAQILTAKDQPTPIPERILQEFADLDDLMRVRDISSEPYEFKASLLRSIKPLVEVDRDALTDMEPHFQVIQGFFRQSDPSLVAFSPQQVLESEFGLMETDDERWDMFKTEIKGEWLFLFRQRSASHASQPIVSSYSQS